MNEQFAIEKLNVHLESQIKLINDRSETNIINNSETSI